MELHLASMENITCWAFRKLFASSCTDSYTGVLSLNNLLRRATWKEVDLYPIPGQRQWIQIATAKDEECKKFIERLVRMKKENPEKYNIYGIQLNCSSPSYHFTDIGQGPALIKRADKVSRLVKILLNQNEFKVSVKTRLGLAEEEVRQGAVYRLFSELEKIKDKNFVHVVVHFKHARENSDAPYNYSMMKKLSEYGIPIIVNGGINNYNDFLRATQNANKKNIIGFMMGREALRNPDCFNESNKILYHKNLPSRTPEQVKKEFEENCEINPPKEGYMKAIKHYCPWAKDLVIPIYDYGVIVK
jgi:tRNA-dihydrouridine synthase